MLHLFSYITEMATPSVEEEDEVSRVSQFIEEETLKEAIPDLDSCDSPSIRPVPSPISRPTAASLGIKEVLSECLQESGNLIKKIINIFLVYYFLFLFFLHSLFALFAVQKAMFFFTCK